MFLVVTLSFSQKKELRTAKKLFSNAQYEEVEKVLLDNQNLFSESDSKLIGQFNFLLAQTYRNLKKFQKAFDRLSLVKNTPSLSKDYPVEAELLKADCVNSAIVDSNEKKYKDSVDKLYIAYLLDVDKNIDYLYFAASNSVNDNDYQRALDYYLVLKEKKYTGIITEYFITEVASGNEVPVSSKEEMEILSKTPEYENPRSNDTPSRFPEIVKNIEKDGALERRFQKIIIEETTVEETYEILKNIKDKYENHHNVTYTDDALKACVDLTKRYVTDRFLPDKAIDALDEAGSRVHINNMNVPQNIIKLENDLENIIVLKNSVVKKQKYEEAARLRDDEKRIERDLISAQNEWDEQSKLNRIKVDESHISEVVSMISGVPVSKIFNKEKSKLSKLNNIIGDKLIGQKKCY